MVSGPTQFHVTVSPWSIVIVAGVYLKLPTLTVVSVAAAGKATASADAVPAATAAQKVRRCQPRLIPLTPQTTNCRQSIPQFRIFAVPRIRAYFALALYDSGLESPLGADHGRWTRDAHALAATEGATPALRAAVAALAGRGRARGWSRAGRRRARPRQRRDQQGAPSGCRGRGPGSSGRHRRRRDERAFGARGRRARDRALGRSPPARRRLPDRTRRTPRGLRRRRHRHHARAARPGAVRTSRALGGGRHRAHRRGQEPRRR